MKWFWLAAAIPLFFAVLPAGAENADPPGESVIVFRPAEAARLPGFGDAKKLPLPRGVGDLRVRLTENGDPADIRAILFSARDLFGKSPKNAVAAIVGLTPEKLKYQLQYGAGETKIVLKQEAENRFSIRPGVHDGILPDELCAVAAADGKTIYIGSRESVRNAERSRDWNALLKLAGDHAVYASFTFDPEIVRHPALKLVDKITLALKRGSGPDGKPRLKGLVTAAGINAKNNARIYLDTAQFFSGVYADAARQGQLKPEHTEAFHVFFRNGRTEIEISLTEPLAADFITLLVRAFETGE